MCHFEDGFVDSEIHPLWHMQEPCRQEVTRTKGTDSRVYWPTMRHDAVDCVQTCDKCQRCVLMNHQHTKELSTLTEARHFMQWDINLVRPLKKTQGNKEYFIVALDYFSKWIEVGPLSKIIRAAGKSFIWKNIICHFSTLIPYS